MRITLKEEPLFQRHAHTMWHDHWKGWGNGILDLLSRDDLNMATRLARAFGIKLREGGTEGQIAATNTDMHSSTQGSPRPSKRKRVQAKDVVPALEGEDALCRGYTELTGEEVPEAFKFLNLRKIVPDKIREKLETVELVTYQPNKDYAINQPRTARNEEAAT